MKNPLVSIILLNLNGRLVLKDCLDSLGKIKYPRWELILVDNGSTDGSETLPQDYKSLAGRYKLIKNKTNLGFAVANNQGYKLSKGDYVLLLNNDTKVTPGFLTFLVERMENDDSLGVVQPKIYSMRKHGYLDNAGSFPTRIGFFYHWGFLEKDRREFEREREIFAAKGACMLIRKSVIEEVGLFDPEFFSYFEETDFCWRVLLAGYKVLFYPKAKIYHMVGFTIRKLDVSNINFHYYKNRISSLIKNLEEKSLLTFLPLHILVSFGIFSAFLLRLKSKNSTVILKSFAWNLLNLPEILKKRKKVQRTRKVSDKELFNEFLYPVDWKRFFQDFKRVEKDIDKKNK